MSKNKARGTAAESAVVNYLREQGWPHAERRALAGTHDKGDVTGVDPRLAIEIKNCATMTLGAWVDEATTEGLNVGGIGVAWHKRRGHGDPGHWYVSMDAYTFVELLKAWCGQ